jgi:hypothetical protein
MAVLTNPGDRPFISAVSAEGPGQLVLDCRASENHAMLFFKASGQSAVFTVQASHDTVSWMPIATYTATATQSATAQYAGYYPYVRGVVDHVYSGAGATGTIWATYAPGLKS